MYICIHSFVYIYIYIRTSHITMCIYILPPLKHNHFTVFFAWGQQFSTFETPAPRINNSRTENDSGNNHSVLFQEESVVILHTRLDSCEDNLETNLNLEYVENLHLTTVLS